MSPTGRLVWLLFAWAAAGLGIHLVAAGAAQAWMSGSSGLALVVVLDLVRGARAGRPSCRRVAGAGWAQGREQLVEIALKLDSGRGGVVEVHDHHPSSFRVRGLPATARLEVGAETVVSYAATATLRGAWTFGRAEIRSRSPFGLWNRRVPVGVPNSVKVLPDLAILRSDDLASMAARMHIGSHRRRRRGEGTEFHQLREYRRGDSLRSIDWKATARQSRLISRDYQEERDQQVLVLLDAGRRMGRRDGAKSHFDLSLEAVLRLAWIAQREGDGVGLLCFSDRIRRWIPPTKGKAGLDRLLEGTFDLEPDDAPPDFLLAAEDVRALVRRRALVILVTTLEEEDASTLRQALTLVSHRHLVLCASLREVALDEALENEPKTFDEARTQASVLHLLEQRSDAISRLGLPPRLLLDSSPRTLHDDLARRYLAIKRAGRL